MPFQNPDSAPLTEAQRELVDKLTVSNPAPNASAPAVPSGVYGELPATFASHSDQRTVNNVMRHEYRQLTDLEKAQMKQVKDMALDLHTFIAQIGNSRELSLAKTKVEEAVMWAVKHVTG